MRSWPITLCSAFASLALLATLASADGGRFAAARGQQGPDPSAIEIDTELVVGGFERPVDVANAGDGTGRLFVVEKLGRIRVVQPDGSLQAEPFLDISDRVQSRENERGLLGLAFHPEFASNGYFYVDYTTSRPIGEAGNGDTVVARYRVGQDPSRADPDSESVLLTIDQPFSNHNGGDLNFGPDDGYLYIATGDGGNGGDPRGNGQNRDSLLAKLLRIDVDGATPYAVPPDNPFVGQSGVRPEIWAWGLRNPWRFTFDRETYDLYIADVGQNLWEEVDFEPSDSVGGLNYGWNEMEGSHCYNRPSCNADGDLVLPIFEYGREAGSSITGGEVYRGQRFGALDGAYFAADYVSGRIWAMTRDLDGAWLSHQVGNLGFGATSFGLDEAGEVYVVFDTVQNLPQAGQLRRLIQRGVTATDEPSPTATPIAPTPTPGSDLIAPGASPRQVSSGHRFTEGPAVDAAGRLYFSDVQQSRIHRLEADGSVATVRDDIASPNGLYFDAADRLVICAMGDRAILRDDRSGTTETLAERWDGKRLNRTNDVYIDPAGGIWFSDPIYGAPPDPQEIPGEQVYYLPPEGGAVVRATDDLVKPNGLIGTPDGETLYVTDPGSGQTWRYRIEPEGRLADKTLFTAFGGDGMTLDARGNVYLATDRVRVFDPAGVQILEIPLPEQPSNLTFGGGAARDQRRTLYVTARTSLYALDMAVAGAFGPAVGATPTPTAGTPTAVPTATAGPGPGPSATALPDGDGRLWLPWLGRGADG